MKKSFVYLLLLLTIVSACEETAEVIYINYALGFGVLRVAGSGQIVIFEIDQQLEPFVVLGVGTIVRFIYVQGPLYIFIQVVEIV